MITEGTGMEGTGTEATGTEATGTGGITAENLPELTPGDTPPADTPPAFSSDYKVKVYDKDFEIPEEYRPFIKDAETEKKAKELFEKFYGFDFVKQSRDGLKSEAKELKTWRENTERGLNELNGYLQKEDYDSFFNAMGIPKDRILRYALKVAERTPEQEAQLLENWRNKNETNQYLLELENVRQENLQLAVQMREIELNQYLTQPGVTEVVQAYNAGQANPAAFRDLVVKVGQLYANRDQDISVQEAVTEAMRIIGKPYMPQGQASQPQANPHGVVTPTRKDTLPNISGGSKSPVKSQIRSIDDIRKRADELG